jgi:hypothetical protein
MISVKRRLITRRLSKEIMGSASVKSKMKKMADSRELDVEYKW